MAGRIPMIASGSGTLKKLVSLSSIYALADFLQAGLAFLLIPLYTTYLTTADYGILSMVTASGNILSVFYLQSLEGAFARCFSDESDPEERRRFLGAIWLFALIYSLGLTLTLDWIGLSTNSLGLRNVPYQPYLRLVVWTTFVSSVALLLPRALFLIREQAWQYAALNIASFTLTTLLIIYFVAGRGAGVVGSLQGRLIGAFLISLPALFIVLRNIRLAWRPIAVRAALVFALPLVPHLLSLWVLNVSDRFILERYVSLSDLGVYTLGYQVASILQILAISMSNAITPYYYRTAAAQSDAPVLLGKVSTYYLAALAWLSVGLVGLAPSALHLLTLEKPAYWAAAQVIPWVALGFFARGYYFVFLTALSYAKKLGLLPLVTIGAGVINVTLNFWLVPHWGYLAAAINTFIAYALQALVMYFLAQRAYALVYETGRLLGLTFLTFVWTWGLSVPMFPQLWLDLGLKTILALAFPLGLWGIRFFSANEILLLRRLKQRVLTF
jgi:O-antigen/teichoic acid export membrane protein